MSRRTSAALPDTPEVGYKRPPQHTRFKKGQSGNPTGKRKAKPSRHQPERLDLSETITLTVQGKRVTMTKRKALHEKLFALAAGGNLRAMELLFRLDGLNDNQDSQAGASGSEVSEREEALIARYFKRHVDASDEGGSDE